MPTSIGKSKPTRWITTLKVVHNTVRVVWNKSYILMHYRKSNLTNTGNWNAFPYFCLKEKVRIYITIPSLAHPILLLLNKSFSSLQLNKQGTSPVALFQTLGHDILSIVLLWWYAKACLDELFPTSQHKLVCLPYQLHDILEGKTAGLLPALQIQNPL